jgi:hypothetical protein
LLAAGVLSGCTTSDTAAGCKPPAHESDLLDAYAVDPVFVTLFHYLSVRIAAAPEQPACPAGG